MEELLEAQSKIKKETEMKTELEDRRDLGSRATVPPSLPLPRSQTLPWVSGASGAISLASGFPGRSVGPSPLHPSRFRETTASLKRTPSPLSPRIKKEQTLT